MEPKEPMEPKKPSTETEIQRIRRQMVGQEITLEEYEKAVIEGLENFPEDYMILTHGITMGLTIFIIKCPRFPMKIYRLL